MEDGEEREGVGAFTLISNNLTNPVSHEMNFGENGFS